MLKYTKSNKRRHVGLPPWGGLPILVVDYVGRRGSLPSLSGQSNQEHEVCGLKQKGIYEDFYK